MSGAYQRYVNRDPGCCAMTNGVCSLTHNIGAFAVGWCFLTAWNLTLYFPGRVWYFPELWRSW